MNFPLSQIGMTMVRDKMSKLADVSNATGVTLLGIAVSDIQVVLNVIAALLGIVATAFTIWFHVSRLLQERRK